MVVRKGARYALRKYAPQPTEKKSTRVAKTSGKSVEAENCYERNGWIAGAVEQNAGKAQWSVFVDFLFQNISPRKGKSAAPAAKKCNF